MLQVPQWESIPQLAHGFCGRRGGVSGGAFADRNFSFAVGDDPDCVRENWRRLGDVIPGVRFVTMRQRHGDQVAHVDATVQPPPQADALVAAVAGVALCVLTADCVPILLVAPQQRVIAAVHAGWRGTVLGIAGRAVEALHRTYGVEPSALHAALGPAIGGCCYEVDRQITDELQHSWGAMSDAVDRGDSKSHLDLRRANSALLTTAGVVPNRILCVGPCTRCAADDYFSYRAAQHAGAPASGRQVSIIGWQI